MRILIHDYAGHPFPVQLSREFTRRGHSVVHAFASTLLTPRGVLERVAGDPEGLKFQAVQMSPDYPKNKYSFIKRLGYERVYGAKLVTLVNEVRPDIILSGQTPSEPQWAFASEARRLRVPMVTWVQDFYGLAVDKLARKKIPFLGALAGRWYRSLDERCFRTSAGIVVITEDFVPVLSDLGVSREKVTVIPNWASLDDISIEPRLNDWSVTHKLADKFVFLYSGTLAMKHNPELLLQVARHFRGDQQVRVVVISEGPGADFIRMRKAAEKLDNLVLLPFQDFSVMPLVLASADVAMAILETDAGVFSVPSKVLTYHAAGKPILAAIPHENLAARIIEEEQSGLCVAPDDIGGFVRNAEDMRRNASTRNAMGGRARAYAEREFDIQKIADRFEEVVARAMGKQQADYAGSNRG